MTRSRQGNLSGVAPAARADRCQARAWACARGRATAKTVLIGLFLFSALARAERSPLRVYSTVDGLPSNGVNCNRRDSRGFLWFCTAEGLSRFDGYTFVNYGVEQGLPDRFVTDFLQTRSGEYWVGTSRGLARFSPAAVDKATLFTAYGTNETGPIQHLLEDPQGTVWIAANGVFQLVPSNGSWSLRRTVDVSRPRLPENLLADHQGNLWIAVYSGGDGELWRRGPDGRIDIFRDDFRGNRILALTEDSQGRIWLGTYLGLALLVSHPEPGQPLIEHLYSKWDGQPTSEVGEIYQSSDGRLWVNAYGRYELLRDAHGQVRFKLCERGGGVAIEDRDGNLWAGPRKAIRDGFVSYGREDGLADQAIHAILEGQDGELYVVSGIHNRYIQRFDGERFTPVAPTMPGHDASWDWQGWGWGQIHLQAQQGEWWVGTGYALLRYPRVKRLEDLAHTPPKYVYPIPDVFRLYQDSGGDIWISSTVKGLLRWQHSTGNIVPFEKGIPWPTAFREDRAGNVWVGCWDGGLLRYRQGRSAWIIPPGALAGSVFSLFVDHVGRLWAGTSRSGLVRVDDPTAEQPTFTVYSTKDGLSSSDVRAITEDHFGRIYFWTGRGVDRLNPDTGRIRHYTEADGLIASGADHNVAFCDRKGRLWFGLDGLSRLDPEPDRPSQPPPIRVTKLRIRGVEYPISELGETDLSGLVLQPNENQIQIEFASLNFAAGEAIRYQYKLEGAEGVWSPASDPRIVNYPNLPPGTYRFLVRAISADGLVSPVPAAIGLRLLPALWRRWWFLTAAGLLASYIVFQSYRYRVRHLLELERVRTRIATDLHDDIGSSLTQIAIMSEVARKQGGEHSAADPLGHIADLSRELVDSMSDIVWAINPKRDQLGDLAQRMRRFVSDVLEAADIEVVFRAPQHWKDMSLSADVRREVFLIFKESVNNIARHAECHQVEVVVDLRGNQLLVELRDDGRGFQTEQDDGHGHGLASMRERARRLGGALEVRSEPGHGTTVTLTVPLGRKTNVLRVASLKQ